MKWIEVKTGYDHWEFDNKDIASFRDRDSSELKSTIKMTEEVIKNQEESMRRKFPDSLHYFLRSGKLYTYGRTPGGILTNEEIKVELRLFTEKEIEEIKESIKWVEHKKVRQWMLDIAFLRRQFGEEYLDVKRIKNVDKPQNYKDDELVKFYFKTAIKINSIPKLKDLEKFASKPTWSRKLRNKNFIIRLSNQNEEYRKAKYNYGKDKIELLEELSSYFLSRANSLCIKERKNEKKHSTVEYDDTILSNQK